MVRMKRVDDGVDVSTPNCLLEAEQGKKCLANDQILAYLRNTPPTSEQESLTGIEVTSL